MLFHSSLRRELARSFGATLLILFTIVITMLLIRTLGQANKGSVNPQEILLVLTYTVLGRLPTVLTLALLIAITSTLSRMYRESEMVIWFSSGRGLSGFLSPLLRFSWPILLVIALMNLFVWPWANQQTDELVDRYEKRGDLERIAPGQFQESSGGRRVFFIDKDTSDGKEGRNVFISSTEKDGRETVTSARTGRIQDIDGTLYLVLENGQRLEQDPQGKGLKISEFKEYAVLVRDSGSRGEAADSFKSMSTAALIGNTSLPHQGELGWRIGLSLTAFNFVFIALALASGNPRSGKSGHLMLMLFAFVLYYNLLNLGQRWVSIGTVSLWPFILVLHGGVLALALAWLTKRHYNVDFVAWFKDRFHGSSEVRT